MTFLLKIYLYFLGVKTCQHPCRGLYFCHECEKTRADKDWARINRQHTKADRLKALRNAIFPIDK